MDVGVGILHLPLSLPRLQIVFGRRFPSPTTPFVPLPMPAEPLERFSLRVRGVFLQVRGFI